MQTIAGGLKGFVSVNKREASIFRLLGSCGSAAVDRSVEQAIRKSDPLPRAPSDSVFSSEIEFNFEPDQ